MESPTLLLNKSPKQAIQQMKPASPRNSPSKNDPRLKMYTVFEVRRIISDLKREHESACEKHEEEKMKMKKTLERARKAINDSKKKDFSSVVETLKAHIKELNRLRMTDQRHMASLKLDLSNTRKEKRDLEQELSFTLQQITKLRTKNRTLKKALSQQLKQSQTQSLSSSPLTFSSSSLQLKPHLFSLASKSSPATPLMSTPKIPSPLSPSLNNSPSLLSYSLHQTGKRKSAIFYHHPTTPKVSTRVSCVSRSPRLNSLSFSPKLQSHHPKRRSSLSSSHFTHFSPFPLQIQKHSIYNASPSPSTSSKKNQSNYLEILVL
eukprot:TRINITY_DN1400_c0_g1_i1.p1 TRINITY_DN1400_c0_g1~~TRINITY_DN1400_c0_g1_i1.p1  ORF type:complete len:320 (+),score=51.60 TRINITY_DN1400_c0_g1_i1:448-1407(+)